MDKNLISVFTAWVLAALFVSSSLAQQTCISHSFSNKVYTTCSDLPALSSFLHWTYELWSINKRCWSCLPPQHPIISMGCMGSEPFRPKNGWLKVSRGLSEFNRSHSCLYFSHWFTDTDESRYIETLALPYSPLRHFRWILITHFSFTIFSYLLVC